MATLTLAPDPITPGSSPTVAGAGFPPSLPVELHQGGALLAVVIADALGAFQVPVDESALPDGAETVIYAITAATDATLDVHAPPKTGPNVMIVSLAATRSAAGAVDITAIVKNVGDTPTSGNLDVNLWQNKTPDPANQFGYDSWMTVPNEVLAPGASVTIQFSTAVNVGPALASPAQGTTDQSVTVNANVNWLQRFPESDYTNNGATCTYVVPAQSSGASYPGPGGPVLLSSRRPDQWPMDQAAACNLPFGNEATFGTVAPNFGSLFWFLLVDHWGMTINRAEPNPVTDEVPQVYIAGDDENHQSFILADGVTAYDGYGAVSQTDRTPKIVSAHYSLKAPYEAAHGGMVYTNMGACGWSHEIGILTEEDVLQGYVGHTLAMCLPGGNLSVQTPFVAPAYRADGAYQTVYTGGARNLATGPWAIGDRFGIPWPTAALGCTSRLGKLLEQGLRTHGAYLDNYAGNGGFKAESTTQMLTWRTELQASGDDAKLVAAIRACTNAGPAAWAGPATSGRRAPLAPAYAY